MLKGTKLKENNKVGPIDDKIQNENECIGLSTKEGNMNLDSTILTAEKSEIKRTKKDQSKITNFFTPTRSSRSIDKANSNNLIENVSTSACVISKHKILQSTSTKENYLVVRVLSSRKVKSPQKYSKVKRKLPNRNILLNKSSNENSSNGILDEDSPSKPHLNGSLKGNSKSKMKNTQMTEFFPVRRSHRKQKPILKKDEQKEKEDNITCKSEDGLKVQNFGKKVRVVAKRHFKKGEMVVKYVGELINSKDAKEREKKYALDSSKNCYMYYFAFQNNQYCIDATDEPHHYLSRLYNNCRKGNLVTTVVVHEKPILYLIAKKDIEPGTEMLYDYDERLSHQNVQLNKICDENLVKGLSEEDSQRPTLNCSFKEISKPKMRNTQMTDFFPVRRSHRKPKTTLLQEEQRQTEEKIISRSEEGLKIQDFGNKGRGIVANRHFKRGEMVVEYVGELIDTKDAKEREKKYSLDSSKGCYMYYFTFQNNQYCIDATEESCYLGRLVNHSRNGNLVTKTVEVNEKPHLILVAKKDIEPGTEILYDYGDRSKQALENHPWLAL